MSKTITALETFNIIFWKYYNEKNHSQIIENIPELLEIECRPNDVEMYQKLCVFSIIVLRRKKIVNSTHVTGICNKYQTVIANTNDPINALRYFICLEYVCKLSGISAVLHGHLIDNLAPAVLNKITSYKHSWTEKELSLLNRFIIVLVELESLLSSSNERTRTFTSAQEAVKFFSIVTFDKRKTAYPEYLLSTLKVLLSCGDNDADSVGKLTEKLRSLVKNKTGIVKDIAIMSSQIIRAGTLLISKGSTLFIQEIIILLDELYEIVRKKSLRAGQYIVLKTYDDICCERADKHAALQVMETVRSIFVEAMKAGNFNEFLVSVMSNFAKTEAGIISQLDCKKRKNIKMNLWQTFRFVTDNIEKIVTTCGLDRAKRTLEKFLALSSLQPSECVRIIKGLLNICKDTNNNAEKISWMAMKIMFNTEPQNRFSCMFDLHQLQMQLDDPNKFETISSIVKGLPKQNYPLHLDAVQLQLLQIRVEIDFPRLPAMCLQKLIDDVCKMDFYKNDHGCYANLGKGGVCYLQCAVHTQQYKSNVKYDKWYDPLNEKFVVLQKEAEIVEKLKEALGYLEKFIRDKDSWMGKEDSAGCIRLSEKLLQIIGRTLMNRHYNDLAVIAFDLLHKFAKIVNQPLSQMIAAGYLMENMHLVSTISEKEVVTEAKRILMLKLKAINRLSADELGIIFFCFLQLTMYTMRQQPNIGSIKHAKNYKAINKFLNKYDSKKPIYLAARQKYADVLYGRIVKGPNAVLNLPAIILDLPMTLNQFTLPRFTSSLTCTIHSASFRNSFLLLFGKATILPSSDSVLINGKRLMEKDHMKQLDVLFACQSLAEPTGTEGGKVTSLIYPTNCKYFQCLNEFLSALDVDFDAVTATIVYLEKSCEMSVELLKRIYNHWPSSNTPPPHSDMLMHCLNTNHREDKSNGIINEALGVFSDLSQAQAISVDKLKIDKKVRGYADEVRPKTVQALRLTQSKNTVNSKLSSGSTAIKERKMYPKQSVDSVQSAQPKQKVNSKSDLSAATAIKDRKTYPKRTNLRN